MSVVDQGTVADLERRLTALEQQVNQLNTGETLTPTYLTVSAEGAVGADFSGTITAESLILPLDNLGVNQVAWEEQPSGSLIASVRAGEFNLRPPVDGSWRNELTLSANLLGGALSTAEVWALAAAVGALILNNNGESDFVLSNSKATQATTGGAHPLPADPAGYLVTVDATGATLKIPYYNS